MHVNKSYFMTYQPLVHCLLENSSFTWEYNTEIQGLNNDKAKKKIEKVRNHNHTEIREDCKVSITKPMKKKPSQNIFFVSL